LPQLFHPSGVPLVYTVRPGHVHHGTAARWFMALQFWKWRNPFSIPRTFPTLISFPGILHGCLANCTYRQPGEREGPHPMVRCRRGAFRKHSLYITKQVKRGPKDRLHLAPSNSSAPRATDRRPGWTPPWSFASPAPFAAEDGDALCLPMLASDWSHPP